MIEIQVVQNETVHKVNNWPEVVTLLLGEVEVHGISAVASCFSQCR